MLQYKTENATAANLASVLNAQTALGWVLVQVLPNGANYLAVFYKTDFTDYQE